MLFVAYRPRESQDKLGLPTYLEQTYTEQFNERKPMEPLNSNNWRDYNRYKDGLPVPTPFRLPPKMFMVVKGLKRFESDFFSDNPIEWIVSGRFRAFLKDHGLLEGQYEESELTILSTTKKSISDKQYYLLRLLRNNNSLIDFEKTPKIVSPKKPLTKTMPPMVYYPALVFQEGVQTPPMFLLDDRSYWRSFFCTEDIRAAMEQEKFLGFDFYTLEDFVQERLEREKRFVGPG